MTTDTLTVALQRPAGSSITATLHRPAGDAKAAAATAGICIANPFQLGDRPIRPLHERFIEAIVAAGLVAITWEPLCEHLIGVDFDRYLAPMAVGELQSVLEAARPHIDSGVIHIIGIGAGGMIAASRSTMANDQPPTTLVLINAPLPADITRIAGELRRDRPQGAASGQARIVPLGFVETVTKLKPLHMLSQYPGRVCILAAAADPIAPIESAWAYGAAAQQLDARAVDCLILPRLGHNLGHDDTASAFAIERSLAAITAPHDESMSNQPEHAASSRAGADES